MNGKFHALLNSAADDNQTHRGTSFIIESLLLLVFVTASIAIVVQLLGEGYTEGVKADRLSASVAIASNDAEKFTADPTVKSREIAYMSTDNGMLQIASKKSLEGEQIEYDGRQISLDDPDIFVLKRTIKKNSLSSGKLYNADIVVTCQGQEIYSLETSKYVPNVSTDEEIEDVLDGDGGA